MHERERRRYDRLRRVMAFFGRPHVLLLVGLLAAIVSLGSYLLFPSNTGGPSRLQLGLLLVSMAIYFRLCFRSGWG